MPYMRNWHEVVECFVNRIDNCYHGYINRYHKYRDQTYKPYPHIIEYLLHNNVIATLFEDSIYLSTCGWNTPTTLSRLNAILHKLFKSKYHLRLWKHKLILHKDDEVYYIPRFSTIIIDLSSGELLSGHPRILLIPHRYKRYRMKDDIIILGDTIIKDDRIYKYDEGYGFYIEKGIISVIDTIILKEVVRSL